MSKKILLVEDEALIAMLTATMIEKHGFEAVTANSGEKAVEIVDSDPEICLILMDIDLGKGIDGTEAAQQILKNHDIPIIFHTSHSEKEYVDKVKKITRYGYVLKNSGEFVLIESINMAFELFEKNQRARKHQQEMETVNSELSKANKRLQKRNKALSKAENLLSNKISLVFDPKVNLKTADLKEVLNIEHIQDILNDFHQLTGMVTALLDLKGNILVATGWKDICTKFHRAHPETAKNCTESDLYLSDNLRRGEFVDYRCKNGLWDVVTPLYIGDTHFGNIYTGQFFYTQDQIDQDFFIDHANKHGFDQGTYIDALQKVPVYNKETVHSHMRFLIGFFELVASQSYTNIALAKESLEHKHSREKLQVSKDHLRITLNSIGDAVISTDTGGNVDRMNPIAEKLTGWPVDAAKGKHLNEIFHIIHADTREVAENPVERVLENGEIVGLANHTALLSKEGDEYQIADSAAPIKDDVGNINGVVLVFRDVTEEYEKDRQLRERVKELDCLYSIAEIVEEQNASIGYILQKTAEVVQEFWQYPETCECKITIDTEIFQSSNFSETQWKLSSDIVVEDVVSGKVVICYLDERPNADEGPFLKKERKLITEIAERLGRIAERKQAENALRENEAFLNETGRIAKIGGWKINIEPQELIWTREVYTLHEVADDFQPTVEKGVDFYDSNSKHAIQKAIDEAIQLGTPFDIELKIITAKNNYLDVRALGHITKDNKGKAISVIGTFQDITERKQVEAALRKSEEELKKAQEITHIGSWYLDIETNDVTWTEELYKMYGFDPTKPVPPYTEHMKLFTPESWGLLSTSLARTRDAGIPYELELQTVREDGSNGWMWVRGERISDENGKIIGLWGAAQDITVRKNAEEKIKKQLAEKETLLKEVHHRIKNNIASIESFLSMQLQSISNPEVVSALQDAITRVQGMRVLYEKLLISEGYQEIPIKEYTESLIEAIAAVFPESQNILIEKQITDFNINTNYAIPFGIIINELLTNVFKYAFKGRVGGQISIILDRTENHVTLSIQDNGIGIDESRFFNKSQGFGLMLVRMVAEQLDGVFTIENHKGTRSVLKFDS